MKQALTVVVAAARFIWQVLLSTAGFLWQMAKYLFAGIWFVFHNVGIGLAQGWKAVSVYWRSISFDPFALLVGLSTLLAVAVLVVAQLTTEQDIEALRRWLILTKPFAPYATASVALLAGFVAVAGIAQRHTADRRAEWWRRAQYGMDLVRNDDKIDRLAGMELLASLLDDQRWHKVDVRTLQTVADVLTREVRAARMAEREGDLGEER